MSGLIELDLNEQVHQQNYSPQLFHILYSKYQSTGLIRTYDRVSFFGAILTMVCRLVVERKAQS